MTYEKPTVEERRAIDPHLIGVQSSSPSPTWHPDGDGNRRPAGPADGTSR